MLGIGLAVTVLLCVCSQAPATTLRLAFADGQPMTHGSACGGEGCLLRGSGIQPTNANGEVVLADAPDRIVEYRRDAIAWWEAPLGVAAGRLWAVGERAAVVLPRMLLATAPAVDAVESEIVALINAERAARGLTLAVLNARLSAAADLQATWLTSTAGVLQLPVLSHLGPFGSTPAFRLGEVSFAEPTGAAEIAAAGWTPAEALANWMASAPHRDQVLAPGPLLIGVAKVGSVIIVTTHPPCAGCESAPLGGSGAGALRPGDQAVPGAASPGTSSTSDSGDGGGPSCGRERLRVQRLRPRDGRMRVRVTVGCVRSSARYTLSVIQRPSSSLLTRRTINGPGAITLALRPARDTRTLRIKLKRNGRVVAARSISRGLPGQSLPGGPPGRPGSPGSGDRGGSSCGAERLRVQRLRARGGRLRVRVTAGCLRSRARYTLSVIQRPARSLLARRRIKGPGAITLALRPARNTRALAIKLKRSGRVVAVRSISRRSAGR